MDYTPEQVQDIQKRQEEVIEFLKEKQLMPAAQLSFKNNGEDVFGVKVAIILADLKYKEEVEKAEKVKEIVGAEVKEIK